MSDGKATREQFVSTAKSFPYTAPQERQSWIIENYSKLSEGMSKQQVAAIIGDPDYSDTIGFKTWLGMRPHGSQWFYCLYCVSQFAGTNGKDKYITVLFDLDGKARWIVPRGIEGLTDRGGPWASN